MTENLTLAEALEKAKAHIDRINTPSENRTPDVEVDVEPDTVAQDANETAEEVPVPECAE